MIQLPTGWVGMRLDKAATVVMGQSPPSSTYNEDGSGLPFFQGKAEFGRASPTPRKWCTEGTRFAEEGDILMSVRAPVGPTNVAAEQCVIGRGLAAIRAGSSHSQRYLLHFFAHSENDLVNQATGTTFAAIRGQVLKAHLVPTPGRAEQDEIVRILDTQLARLDTVMGAVQAVRDKAEQFRRSLLHATFTGELIGETANESVCLKAIAELAYGFTDSATTEPIGPKFLRITDTHSPNIDWEEVPFCSAEGTDLESSPSGMATSCLRGRAHPLGEAR